MISLLKTYLRPYAGQLALVIALLFVATLGNLFLPSMNADIINSGVVTGDTGYIVSHGLLMLLVSLVVGVVSIIGVYYSARVSMAVGRDMRAGMFRTVQRFSLREVNTFGAASLITRNTNDVQQVQMFVVLALTMMVMAPIMMVGGVVMALREDVVLSSLLIVIIPLMIGVVSLIMFRAVPMFRAMQVKLDTINRVLRENLTGIRVIRAFVKTEHEEKRFAEANADLTQTSLSVARLFAFLMPALMLILNLSSVAIVWFGGHRVDSGAMPVGNLTAFLSYLMQILFSVMMASMVLMQLPRAAAAAERIADVLALEPDIHDPEVPGTPTERGTLEFRNVTFQYPGAEDPVLEGISITVEAGRTTAIIGSTGSGKTTLVNLIPRLYDVTAGSVLVDGLDVRSWARQDLWRRLGIVPQKSFLFNKTIAENLRLGAPDASDEDLWSALRIAQGEGFVRALPDGLNTLIDQGGTNVSGGQRQRLAIARALVRRPEFYIFDDSLSALDMKTDAALRAALARETKEATVLIVAQRVSSIRQADRIIVLDEGRIAGIGTHRELMDTCETYQEIVLSQLTMEEAA